MALVTCPECHGSVSDQAATCPHCGHPLATTPAAGPSPAPKVKKSSSKAPLVVLAVLLIVWGVLQLRSWRVQRELGSPRSSSPVAAVFRGDQDYSISVTGSKGLTFHGSYMAVAADGSSSSQSVEGTVPANYTVNGKIVSTTFQKKGEDGNLTVRISRDGAVVKEATTSAAYGVAAAAAD